MHTASYVFRRTGFGSLIFGFRRALGVGDGLPQRSSSLAWFLCWSRIEWFRDGFAVVREFMFSASGVTVSFGLRRVVSNMLCRSLAGFRAFPRRRLAFDENIFQNKSRHTTARSRFVSMIYRNYKLNPVSDIRPRYLRCVRYTFWEELKTCIRRHSCFEKTKSGVLPMGFVVRADSVIACLRRRPAWLGFRVGVASDGFVMDSESCVSSCFRSPA
jgi:hypothetical protein